MHPKTEDGPSPSCIHCVLHRIELDSLRLENEKLKESLVHLSTQKTEEANRNRQLQINLNDTRTELASTRGALVKIKVEMARIGIQSRVETENVKAVTIDDEDEISKIKTQGDSQSPIRPKRSRRASPDVESIRRSPKRTKLEEVNITAEPTNSTTNTILESGTEAKDVNYVAGSTALSLGPNEYHTPSSAHLSEKSEIGRNHSGLVLSRQDQQQGQNHNRSDVSSCASRTSVPLPIAIISQDLNLPSLPSLAPPISPAPHFEASFASPSAAAFFSHLLQSGPILKSDHSSANHGLFTLDAAPSLTSPSDPSATCSSPPHKTFTSSFTASTSSSTAGCNNEERITVPPQILSSRTSSPSEGLFSDDHDVQMKMVANLIVPERLQEIQQTEKLSQDPQSTPATTSRVPEGCDLDSAKELPSDRETDDRAVPANFAQITRPTTAPTSSFPGASDSNAAEDLGDGERDDHAVPANFTGDSKTALTSASPNLEGGDLNAAKGLPNDGETDGRADRRSGRFAKITKEKTLSVEGNGKHVAAVSRQKSAKAKTRASQQSPMAADPLWDQTVATFLANIPCIKIDPAPDMTFGVARRFLNHHYEINTGSFIAIMKPENNPTDHSQRRPILFPLLEANPNLPTGPGNPGIILTARKDILEIQPITVFIKCSGRKSPALWLYAGEYILEESGVLTGEQFSQLPHMTQQNWADCLHTMKRDVWSSMRARIYLRKHKLPLTDQNIANEQSKIKNENKAKSGTPKPGHLVSQDYINAFINGEEHLNLIMMKCIGYDHAFVQHMKEQNDIWTVTNAKATVSQQGEGRRRSRSNTNLDVKDPPPVANSSGVEEEPSSSASGPRRSTRPRKSLRWVPSVSDSESDGAEDSEYNAPDG